ncbi:DUF4164 domain-containing protein [Liberibacter crescens]|uniref:DUF4164 domain-containing protein n=1 Tax=Liberibacter crescens TaxID=1273132 RepID=UPI0005A17085|nr:DUF4164 domain-containing protein [Liberibacter crescens]AMC13416.1 tropomyosin [Liberibacter crescens]
MFPTEKKIDINQAIDELKQALGLLENATDVQSQFKEERSQIEKEVRRIHADRSRLAQALDQSEFRANRLEEINREVSRRLVTAMETIRAVLDR